jgi:hypothetical protein
VIDENGANYHFGFTFRTESLQVLNDHRAKYHKFKLSEGDKRIIPITFLGKTDSTGIEIHRHTRDKVRKRRRKESILPSNLPEEIETLTWQGYSQCGYRLPANMNFSYRFCLKHMHIMDLIDTSSAVYPEPEGIIVKYFDIHNHQRR